MTWQSFRRQRRNDQALLRYWDDIVRRRPATPVPPPEVDEDLASLIRALHPATSRAPERPAYADDLLSQLLATYKETTPMNATASTAPPAVPDFLPRPATKPERHSQPQERVRRNLAPALEITLIIALILASLGVLWISTNETRQAVAPTAATLTAEGTVASPSDVPMYRGNAERTGVFPGPGIDGQPVELWQLSFPGPINSAPAIVNNVLYIGIGDGGVHAIDAATGATIWTYTGTSSISSSPAVVDGMVYVGSDDGTLYALNAADGSEAWTAPGTRSLASVAVVDGVVYTGGGDGTLTALDARSGEEIWQAPLSDAASRSPAVSDGVVYMGSGDGVLHTFDAATGEPGWAVQLDGDGVISTTVVIGGVVYEGTFEGDENYYFALDAATGDEIWRFASPSGGGFLSAATDGETVYTVSEDTHVYAFDAASGEVRWQFETDDKVIAVPALVGDTLYVASNDERVYALEATTGSELWQYPIKGKADYGPVVSGGVAYVGTEFGYLYAIGGSNDAIAQAAQVASPLPATPFIATPAATPKTEASPDTASPLATFLWETDGSAVEIGWPTAPVVAPDGTIWLADGGLSLFHLFASDGTYLESWGTAGTGDGEFTFTMSGDPGDGYGEVAFAPDGSFYVVDTGNRRVQHFSEDREFLTTWGEFGPDDGEFLKPIGLTVDLAGHVYVIDETREDIQKFDADGTHLLTFGGPGSEPGQLDFPGWITLGPDGGLWVGDADNHRIQQFDSEGQVLAILDGDGTLVTPVDVAVTEDGYILVADEGAWRVVILDPGGSVMGYLGEDGGPMGLHFPWLIASDGDGNVLVSDYISDSPPEGRLVKFQLELPLVTGKEATPTASEAESSLATFLWETASSTAFDEMGWPSDVTVAPDGTVWIVDSGTSELHQFDPDGTHLATHVLANLVALSSTASVTGAALVFDDLGNAFILDTENHRVLKFAPDWSFILEWGSQGTDDGQFLNPSDLAVDSQGNVYVNDWKRSDIQKFDTEGRYLATVDAASANEAAFPGDLARIGIDTKDNLYVPTGSRVFVFGPDGSFIRTLGDGNLGVAVDAAVDAAGNVFVSDAEKNQIQVYGPDGTLIGSWGAFGNETGEFIEADALALDGLGHIYVVDFVNERVQKFSVSLPSVPGATPTPATPFA